MSVQKVMLPQPCKIPLYLPGFDQREREVVQQYMTPEAFSGNAPIAEFETAFARSIGANGAIAVSNGSTALHLALIACGLQPGDEVIVPALTFVASANAVKYVGAEPVCVDVDAMTWQMSVAQIEAAITARTRAIMVVHLYGHASHLSDIRDLANRHGLLVIEDCAEALGTLCHGRHVGLDADVATFSFYKNKTITTGEGGAVITRHSDWHERMDMLKAQGVSKNRRYWHAEVGYNYRMTNLAAAIGLVQLEKLAGFVTRKQAIAHHYQTALKGFPMYFQAELSKTKSSWWLISATLADELTRDALMEFMKHRSIETRPVFLPLHRYPMYETSAAATPNAETISACGLSLPSWPGLTDAQIKEVSQAIQHFFEGAAYLQLQASIKR